ncbi:MAG: hypothetical protein AAF826_01580 [Pseudomonadota bacterium]
MPDHQDIYGNKVDTSSMLSLFKKAVWPPDFQIPPWGDRKSIFDHIAAHIEPERAQGLSEEGYRLPDEPEADSSSISFAPGAMDGAFGHHGSTKSDDEIVRSIHAALVSACQNASDRNVRSLYKLILDSSALAVIDPLIERILEEQALDADRLREIVVWFATKAPDREPVKFSMALLGLLRGNDDSDIFLTLGRHDEFTLYSAVALSNSDVYGDEALWKLAIAAEGWGRISTVERLADTNSAEIKDWLLRDGFKNSVMYEYLACICARAGDLHLALKRQEDDPELFNSAVELIDTLVSGEGGPAEGLSDYEHGCAAIQMLLRKGDGKWSSASHFWFLWKLKERIAEHLSGERVLEQDWTEQDSQVIAEKIEALLSTSEWKDVLLEALQNGDRQSFWDASRSCEKLGIDPWKYFLDRTKAGEDYWWDLMRTSDASRIDNVLALAAEKIPLEEISTGPGNDLGLGIEYASHSALDFILQDLGNFPGKGWDFVKAGLRSPVIRNRNMAIRALSDWGQDNWPDEATECVKSAIIEETEEDVQKRLENALAGRELN